MDNNDKKILGSPLPAIDKINDATGAKAFSAFCEATCKNFFSFEPDMFNREEFLNFQCLADDLKAGLNSTEHSLELCKKAHCIYESLISSVYNAFLNSNNKIESGKLVALQIIATTDFEKNLNSLSLPVVLCNT